MLTGNKDIDTQILQILDDCNLRNIIQTNKYFNNLCKDDNFWSNRINIKYEKSFEDILLLRQEFKNL